MEKCEVQLLPTSDHFFRSDSLELFPTAEPMELSGSGDSVSKVEKSDDELADLSNTSEIECGNYVDFSLPIHQILFDMNRIVCDRLDNLESKINSLTGICTSLQYKVEGLSEAAKFSGQENNLKKKIVKNSMIVDVVSNEKTNREGNPVEEVLVQHMCFGSDGNGANARILTLNSEGDFPNGSWLGDEKNPEMRVRCRIPAKDLFLINNSNTAPEKMALTLLDHLFDRETQASSNISGTGKHKKKQLDPLMICGIWCHLKYRFGISEKHWHRIRQNLDSKCRSAYRKIHKGSMKEKAMKLASLGDFKDYDLSSNVSTASSASKHMMDSDFEEPSHRNSDSSSSANSEVSVLKNLECQMSLPMIGDDDLVQVKKVERNSVIVDVGPHQKRSHEGSSVEAVVVEHLRFGGESDVINSHFLTESKRDDFPNGSWLGDEKNPEMRVRCCIPTKDLSRITANNSTPEKLALTLLDHLVDKQTQASSNISGTGKNNKKQLDPFMIYGIWCHLKHRFGISERHWHRIRLSLDSKCRSAHRKSFNSAEKERVRVCEVSSSTSSSTKLMGCDCVKANIQDSDSNSSVTSVVSVSRHLDNQTSLPVIGDDFVPTEVLNGPELVEVFEATPEQIAKMQESGFHILLDNSPIISSDDLNN